MKPFEYLKRETSNTERGQATLLPSFVLKALDLFA